MPQPQLPPSGSGFGARSAAAVATPAQSDGKRSRSSPLARRLAAERGIELSQVLGSGPGGRIVKKDIESAVKSGPVAAAKAAAPKKIPRFITRDGDYQDIANTQIRKTIARRLAESIGPVPTYYLTAEFDAGRAADMRAQLKELGDDYKVSFNDIVIKAVANALSEHPEVNAWWMGDYIRHFNRVHVAMAVAIPDGLITPVIFDADRKGIGQIGAEARDLAEKARQRKLTPEQYTGATFSVSNLGMFGIDQFTAIINPPEAGILAIGGVEAKPVVEDGQVVVRQRMRVTMSCDHRVIDGATGARFLQTVKRLFENPLLLVI
jgi:pyruvate dehydrogenase E2 component (dihydrolipoamide acetyltransferase)